VHELTASGEWVSGIRAALTSPGTRPPYFDVAESYLNVNQYPAGWLFFATRACRRIRRLTIHLHDIQSEVAVRYKETVEGCPENVEVLFKLGDGFDLINDGSEPSLVCQNLKGCGMLVSKELQPLLESASNELVQSAARLNSRLEQRVPTARSK